MIDPATPIVGVYADASHAGAAIRALEAAGISADDISVLTRTADEAQELTSETGVDDDLEELIQRHPLSDALNWLGRVGAWAVPGFGGVLGTGNVGADLSRAERTRGAVTGVLVGAGIPVDEAQQFEDQVRTGHVLVVVHDTRDPEHVRDLLTIA
jgi:hypothetical protein